MKIYFQLGQQRIEMMFDPSDQDICNYKRIKVLCKEHDIPFRNQSFNQFVDALKTRNFDKLFKQFYEESPECNHCKTPVSKSKFHLDHIEALANGGTNQHDNIQVLCISCHSCRVGILYRWSSYASEPTHTRGASPRAHTLKPPMYQWSLS